MTPYRLEKLEQVGFSWQIRTSLDPDDEDYRLGDDQQDANDSMEPVKLDAGDLAGNGPSDTIDI